MTHPPSTTLPAPRQCGDCALCCHLGEIAEVKPFNAWCQHCSTRHRCDIYPDRPRPCRDFYCHYLLSDIDECWNPQRCGMVVSTHTLPLRLNISVDPATPDIWRQQPFFPQIHYWAQQGAVTVQVGLRCYAVYPEQIEDLGEITAAHTLLFIEQQTGTGTRYQIRRVLRSEADAALGEINRG